MVRSGQAVNQPPSLVPADAQRRQHVRQHLPELLPTFGHRGSGLLPRGLAVGELNPGSPRIKAEY